MDEVTDAGKGASVFIPDTAEAWKLFNADFVNTMAIAERNVQVELTMPPGFEIVAFSGEEFSGNPEEVEPQHIAPNDAMVFYQQIETCAPELIDVDSPIGVKVTWQDRETFEDMSLEMTYTFGQLLDGDATLLSKGAAVYAYAQALREYKAGGGAAALEPAISAVAAARLLLPQDTDLLEIEGVLQSL
jgi:Ca-activated chloride channel family protein